MPFLKTTNLEGRQRYITRGEQLAVELDREYQRRWLGDRQPAPSWFRRSRTAPRDPRTSFGAIPQYERIAEMLVELSGPALTYVLQKLHQERLCFSDLAARIGAVEAGTVSNRLGLASVAVLEGDTFVVTPEGHKFLEQLAHGDGFRHEHA